MKTHIFTIGAAGLLAGLIPLVNGCDAQSSEVPKVATNAPVAVVTNAVPANTNLTPEATLPEPATELAAKPEAAPVAPGQKSLPPNLNPASPSAEIVKLAQAGVDDAVLLAYITNSTKTFNLGSDEIIYLNDLGVSGSVVTTMIEHDKAMKEFWASSASAQNTAAPVAPAPTTEQAATAPTYVNPPEAPVEPQPTVVNNNYFYDTLSPYGTWIDVEGYGRCWQPTVVVGNRNWQPYCDRGRWINTDAGWYWLSDYSWGSTAFHYGRWFNHARWGWCWYPDRVWGPSWVTWRYSNDYCGWAPLPPSAIYRPGIGFSYRGRSVGFGFDFGIGASWFTFVPTARFCDPRPYHHRVSAVNVTKVYNNTTIINNFSSGNHNTVINRGIDPDRIRPVSRTEIRTVALRDAPQSVSRGSRAERLDRDGRTLTVNRPGFSGNHDAANLHRPVASEPARPIDASRGAASRPTLNGSSGRDNPSSPQHRDERPAGPPRSNFVADERNASSPAVNTPLPTKPAVVNNPTKSREPRPAASSRPEPKPAAQNLHSSGTAIPNNPTVSPSTGRGEERPAHAAPPTPTKPAQPSYVIIGRKDAAPTPVRSPYTVYSSPTPRASSTEQIAEVAPTRPTTPTQTWAPGNSQTTTRSESLRTPRNSESRGSSQSTYSAHSVAPVQRANPTVQFSTPAPSQNRAPSYTPPSTPSVSRSQPSAPPVQSYSAPRSQSFSAPAPAAPAPSSSGSRSQSAPSSPSRSDSGSRGRDRN